MAQNRGNLLLNLIANKSILGQCHLLHIDSKTSERRDHCICMVWPSLDSLSATMFSQPGMCQFFCVFFWYSRSRHSAVGHKVGPTSCLLPCLCMTLLQCCRLLQLLSCSSRGLGTPLELERLLLVPGSLYAVCFLEVTRSLL